MQIDQSPPLNIDRAHDSEKGRLTPKVAAMLSSTKSMEEDSAHLAVLRDPKRMAALLVRALSTSVVEATATTSREEEDEEEEETQEAFQELERRASASRASDSSSVQGDGCATADDDDDDAGEEDEEDEDEEKPLDDDELEAAAAALQSAMRIVKELQCKKGLVSGRSMEPHESTLARAEQSSVTTKSRPGIPMPRARVRLNASCCGCGKSFYPFHRSRHCASCGFAFCFKCSAKSVLLPTCFGYREASARTCDLCAKWFQKAMNGYFDTTDGMGRDAQGHRQSLRRGNDHSVSSSSMIEPTVSATKEGGRRSCNSSFEPVPSEEGLDASGDKASPPITVIPTTTSSKRHHRLAAMSVAPSSSNPKNKTWFSGHLRAIHVNDRLPRKRRGRGESEGNEIENNGSETPAQLSRLSSMTSIKSRITNEDADDSVDFVETDWRDGQDRAYMAGALRTVAAGREASLAKPSCTPALDAAGNDATRARRKPRRSKFARSASFDLTNLHASVSPLSSSESPGMTCSSAFGLEEGKGVAKDVGSNLSSGRSNSIPSQKAFDDSDIVDERAKLDSAEVKLQSEAKLSAAVLRFAVYEMGGKEGTGLRRTFGFAKANPVLDRYTLELDCRQRLVRAKSVFMHRFWSFHCDSVQSFLFRSSEGMARLIVFNGGQGQQSLELKFANNDEREQFKEAIDSCRSTNLKMRRGFAPRPTTLLAAQSEGSASPVLDSLQSPVHFDPANTARTIRSELSLSKSPVLQSIYVPLLPGEAVMKGTEQQATLLVGPASETFESAQVWGRIRGKIAVTNYRVLFTPFDQVSPESRCNHGQGGVAYIPLFGITNVQLLYPGGRRTKSGRTNYAGMTGSASIISISCKDVRVMRFQLDSHPAIAAHELRATIARAADASQRYYFVDRESLMRTASSEHKSFPAGASDCDRMVGREGSSEEGGVHQGKEPYLSSAYTSSRTGGNAAFPVPCPDPIRTLPRERSGSFAMAYSIGNVRFEQNGWKLFVDEREFRRQIGGDPAVSLFLKFYKNDTGNICKTYPSKLLLPASTTSTTLAKVTAFRAKNRLPVITYYHRRNRCVLTRSSQPLLGNLLSGTSNVSDQLLLGVYRRLPDIIKNQSQSSQSSRPLYIFDARKPQASTGNRLMGKGGVETPQDYPGAVVYHLNIANMYRMQSSYMGLMKLLLPGSVDDTDRTWLSSVESTRWLDHVRLLLDGALKIARVLELEGASALVHCSDGWDRTSQLCALAQLMIDPYYRTIRGFAVLVEKDWLAFGHKYAERCGSDRNRDPQRNKSSPVMLQFLDAVWQMQRQHSHLFEFNERFLLHLANALTSGLYGTFLYDSRLQRDVNQVKSNTVSVWTPVLMKPDLYSTSNYTMHKGPVWPWVSCHMIRLWDNYFFQWHPKFHKCQWVCSLIYYGPSTYSSGTSDGTDENREEGQEHHLSRLESTHVKDGAASDLLASSTNVEANDKDDELLTGRDFSEQVEESSDC